ncbi:unnamed protein product, partial [Allacma fusca]
MASTLSSKQILPLDDYGLNVAYFHSTLK